MSWYVDRRTGLTSVPWRMLPSIPLLIINALLCAIVFVPILVILLLGRLVYLRFAKAETPSAES
jgi:hypothetical protein